MRNSSKQDKWANDIKVRINLLLNGFEAKCFSPTDDDLDLINRVQKIIHNTTTNYIIDEFKGLTDEALVKMFDMDDTKFCKVFRLLFNGKNSLYQIQQKQRLEFNKKLQEIKDKYGSNDI